MSMFENFTNMYNLSKTLRFGLIPQGKTLEHIEKSGLLEEDELRAEEKANAQALADGYHKKFIDNVLSDFRLGPELAAYANAYLDPSSCEDAGAVIEDASRSMIEAISRAFTGDKGYKDLFKGKLFSDILPSVYADDPKALATLEFFDGFTTYFTGYNRNRQLLYAPDGKKGSVGNRLINENLPIFLDNYKKLQLLREAMPEELDAAPEKLDILMQGYSPEDVFGAEAYDAVLTQRGIDRYNQIIGGYTEDSGAKIQGLNECINLANQKAADGRKLPLFTQLRKQVLSDRTTLSFIPEAFSDDADVVDALLEFDRVVAPAAEKLTSHIAKIESFDLNGVYIRKKDLSAISNKLFDSWHYIDDHIADRYDALQGASEKTRQSKKYMKEKAAALGKVSAYSIGELDTIPGIDGKVSRYIAGAAGFAKGALDFTRGDFLKCLRRPEGSMSLKRDDTAKAAVKNYLDAVLEVQHLAASLEAKTGDKDVLFYDGLNALTEELGPVSRVYDKTRNYLSGKLYTTEKIKLNFGSAVLLDGWAESTEGVKRGTLLFKDGRYFLGIIAKGQGDLFKKVPEAKTDDYYVKMRYNQISDPSKQLPHAVFSKKGIDFFRPSQEILDIYREKTFVKGSSEKPNKDFDINDCHALIDFYKECLGRYPTWSLLDLDLKDTSEYDGINGFYNDIAKGAYDIRYRNIDTEVVDALVENGQLYLFEIWHKDFSPKSKGKPDLSTMYWRALFDPSNTENLVYKLNGGAEVFFRRASIKDADIIRHKAGDVVRAKNPMTKRQSKVLKYDIVKDRRFTVDRFQFNVPIKINAASPDYSFINTEAKLAIKHSDGVHVIGVSRGENSLIQVCVLDPDGNIVEKKNLNVIESVSGSGVCRTDYAALLSDREAARMQERKSWGSVENIKQLKDGYISQVVRVLANLMLKYNAVLAIEDLSLGFKQSRQKIEKAVYQQLEQRLINKLNFLVNKEADPCEPGGLFKGYQLTAPFQGFDRIGRQTGFIFYVSPWKTSEIDPVTGFVNRFDTRYSTITAAKTFWHAFDKIVYDPDVKAYRFDFDYGYFLKEDDLRIMTDTRTRWSVYSHGSRIAAVKTDKGFTYKTLDLTDEITALLKNNGIEPEAGDDLRDAVCGISSKPFHESLLFLFGLMVKMRSGSDIVSPVMDQAGSFFSGSKDENSAYNIARKGLVLVNRIKAADDEELAANSKSKVKAISLSVTAAEWLSAVQG